MKASPMLLLLAILAACAGDVPAPPALPDLGAAEPQVAEKLRGLHARLEDGRAQDWRRYARTLHAHEFLEEATAAYDVAAGLSQKPFEDLYLGGQAARTRDPERARALLLRAEALRPDDARLLETLAEVELDLGRPEAARDRLVRALELRQSARGLLGMARALLALGEHEEAAVVAEGARRAAPGARDVLALLAVISERRGRRIEARRFSELAERSAVEIPIDDPLLGAVSLEAVSRVGLLRRARAMIAGGLGAEAVRVLAQARRLDPEEPSCLRLLAQAALLSESPDLALETARDLLRREPEDVQGLYLEAEALVMKGEKLEALNVLERARALDPDHVGTRYRLGWLLGRARPEEALAHLEHAFEVAPLRADARELHARLLVESGRRDEARRALERWVDLDPAAETPRKMLLTLGR